MYCTKCGKQIADSAKFCGFCGQENVSVLETNKPVIGQNNTGAPVTAPSWLVSKQPPARSELHTQNNSISKEISDNKIIFAIPYLYLVVQLIHIIMPGLLYRSHVAHVIINFIGSLLFGAIYGGLVFAIKRCSSKFKWVYLIPYIIVGVYYSLGNLVLWNTGIANFLFSAASYSLVFVVFGVIAGTKESQPFKDNSQKSMFYITAISLAVVEVLSLILTSIQEKVMYGIEFGETFRMVLGYLLYFVFQLLGAIISVVIAYKTSNIVRESDGSQKTEY